MTEILRNVAYFILCFTPKREVAVIWGWPDNEDSVIALEQALQNCNLRKVVILTTNPDAVPSWESGSKTTLIPKKSLSGWWWFSRAKYIFFTHRCFLRKFPSNVVSVNIWHGMPIKRIGCLLDETEGITSDYTLATSPFWAEIMDRSLHPKEPTLTIGLPRNDRLFSSRQDVYQKLGLNPDQKLLAWLPTYRDSVLGEIRRDGTEYGNVFEMPDTDPDTLNDFLASLDTVMIVKPHPMAHFDQSRSYSHLKIVDNNWLHARKLSLYEFIGATHALISDISSVVVDYLLLDRPIIHAFPDMDAYRDSRGFSIEPISDYFMGPVVTNYGELLIQIQQVLSGADINSDKRSRMKQLFHTHTDNKSTERLLDSLKLK